MTEKWKVNLMLNSIFNLMPGRQELEFADFAER